MQDISRLSHQLDKKKRECKAIIETPKGRRNKFKYEPDSGLFSLSRLLPQGFSFPFDFGFIPSTTADDGDPLDIMVLMDEPAHVGCLLGVRVIGVIEATQTEDGKQSDNHRLIGVSLVSFDHRDITSIRQIHPSTIEQISEFLVLYNKNSGKQLEVKGIEGPERALEIVESAIAEFDRKQKKS